MYYILKHFWLSKCSVLALLWPWYCGNVSFLLQSSVSLQCITAFFFMCLVFQTPSVNSSDMVKWFVSRLFVPCGQTNKKMYQFHLTCENIFTAIPPPWIQSRLLFSRPAAHPSPQHILILLSCVEWCVSQIPCLLFWSQIPPFGAKYPMLDSEGKYTLAIYILKSCFFQNVFVILNLIDGLSVYRVLGWKSFSF